ncbi:MAG TPA: hypothetical protein DCR55_18185 [Lentisphaeria bacterium]|nr:hypothetical protein [Lentisphaeria bacterium]
MLAQPTPSRDDPKLQACHEAQEWPQNPIISPFLIAGPWWGDNHNAVANYEKLAGEGYTVGAKTFRFFALD